VISCDLWLIINFLCWNKYRMLYINFGSFDDWNDFVSCLYQMSKYYCFFWWWSCHKVIFIPFLDLSINWVFKKNISIFCCNWINRPHNGHYYNFTSIIPPISFVDIIAIDTKWYIFNIDVVLLYKQVIQYPLKKKVHVNLSLLEILWLV